MSVLVICEKNSAASRIAYLLSDGGQKKHYYSRVPYYRFKRNGEEFTVVGLRGHIVEVDYPDEYNDWSSVDEEELIRVQPKKEVTAKRIANLIGNMLNEVEKLIIATDFDREGELIGMEAVELIRQKKPEIEIKRARFSSLSKYEIEEAFSNLQDIDVKLAKSAETRQVVDLAWGAVLTRFLSKTSGQYGKNFISAGRVQSPALALIVDREIEIENFEPEPYWYLEALLEKEIEFRTRHEEDKIWDPERAEKIYQKVEEAELAETTDFVEEEKKIWPWPPFNTTQFLSDATKLDLSPAQAMKTAEDLYTAGWISYPRTENTVYPRSLNLRKHLEKLRSSELTEEIDEILSQKKIRATRGKKETTDHPPIYPIKAASRSDLKGRRWKVYEMILRRFLVTVAPAGKAITRKAEFDIEGELFEGSGYKVVKEGWLKYYPYYRPKESDIPALEVGESVEIKEIELSEDETKPPRRYNQGKLIREMEKLGLGTKSTRHQIIQKLYDRGFVSGKVPRPTHSGKAVIKTLQDHAETVTRPEMTSTLEKDMEKIAEGVLEQGEVVDESKEMLEEVMATLKKEKEEIRGDLKKSLRSQNAVGRCSKCGGTLVVKKSKKGRFVGCTNYPDCTNTYRIPRAGNVKPANKSCPECGAPKIIVFHKGDTEELCVDLNCKYSRDKRYRGECPECGGDIVEMRSYRGKRFLGCSKYPDCKKTYPLPQWGKVIHEGDKCSECSSPIIKVISKGKKPWELCPNMDCPSKEE